MAQIHDRHGVAQIADDVQVMRNEKIAQTETLLEFLQEIDDLSLDRNVKGGSGSTPSALAMPIL